MRLFPILKEKFVVSEAVKELIDIVIKLRSDNGCDWDRKQTSESLTPHLIEEANEVVDAVLELSLIHI